MPSPQGGNRAPRRNGFSLEFYKTAWPLIGDDFCRIINSMFFDRATTTQQKLGTIACLPKSGPMLNRADRRPITLLNTDYKILARVIARRLRPLLALHLNATQYCGVPGNTIFDAVATVRDVIAHAEHEKLPVCVLTLDFQHAFDKLSHHFAQLWSQFPLRHPNPGAIFGGHINYANQRTSIRPLPHSQCCSARIPIKYGIIHSALHPLLTDLEHHLPGVRIGRSSRSV